MGGNLLPRLSEQELFCHTCEKSLEFPRCCSNTMEFDNVAFFCPVCHKVRQVPACCGQTMTIRKKVYDIKKKIFGEL